MYDQRIDKFFPVQKHKGQRVQLPDLQVQGGELGRKVRIDEILESIEVIVPAGRDRRCRLDFPQPLRE